MLNGQQVPNLLVCHERVAAHERGLSKEVLLYDKLKVKLNFVPVCVLVVLLENG